MSDRQPEPTATQERAQERMAAALALLDAGIGAIVDGPSFRAYLATLARFPTYSARNVALIHAQRPDATRVAGYRAWQALGRQVCKGERGIRILAPYRRVLAEGDEQGDAAERGALVTGFGVATVFDLAQTEGRPLAEAPAPHLLAGASDTAAWLWERLAAFLAAEGLALAREETGRANGYYAPALRRVAVHARLTGDQATKTLAHECAHHVAGARAGVNGADAETIAEGAAFVVLAHCGIDAGGYTFPYVARWAADRAVLTRNLEAIRAVAYTLIHVVTSGTDAALDAAA
jgi:DNA primase